MPLPLILSALPSLIAVAEKVFSRPGEKTGSVKKEFVLKVLGLLFDSGIGKILPDWENVDERRLFLRTADVWIDELVPSLIRDQRA